MTPPPELNPGGFLAIDSQRDRERERERERFVAVAIVVVVAVVVTVAIPSQLRNAHLKILKPLQIIDPPFQSHFWIMAQIEGAITILKPLLRFQFLASLENFDALAHPKPFP